MTTTEEKPIVMTTFPVAETEPSKELAVVPVREIVALEAAIKENGVEAQTAVQLLESFRPIFAEVHRLVEQAKAAPVVTDATQLTEMNQVREIRLALARQRIRGDKVRETLKAEGLRRNNAIQGVFNLLKFMVEPLEESLLESEKFAERAEAARKDLLRQTREKALMDYGVDVIGWPLGDMPVAQYDKLLENTKLAHQAKIDAAAKAESDRIAKERADAAERERVRLENERLKKEAEEKSAQLEAERKKAKEEADKADAEAKRLQERAAKEKAALEAKAKAEHESAEKRLAEQQAAAAKAAKEAEEKAAKERAEVEAKAKAEREEAERIAKAERERLETVAKNYREAHAKAEAEAKALRDAEAKKKADEAVAAKKAAAAPDKEKLIAFAGLIKGIGIPNLSTERGKEIGISLTERKVAWFDWIMERADSL